MTERGPAIRFAEDVLGGELARAQFLVAPEQIAPRPGALGEQAIGETDRLDSFAVVDGFHLDAGFLLELVDDRLGVFPVLRGVNDYSRLTAKVGDCWQQYTGEN
jgi:hypothetical protein